MQELLNSLGLDWKLFLAQAINFFILLVILRFTVYKPVVEMLHRRKKQIEEGITKSKEAEYRLNEISQLKKEKLKEAEVEVGKILSSAEERARAETEKTLAETARKKAEMERIAQEQIKAEKEIEMKKLYAQGAALIKNAVAKAVEIDPGKIDDKLIQEAIKKA